MILKFFTVKKANFKYGFNILMKFQKEVVNKPFSSKMMLKEYL